MKQSLASTYLITVHVTLRPASSLEYNQWKMVDEFAGDNLPIVQCQCE